MIERDKNGRFRNLFEGMGFGNQDGQPGFGRADIGKLRSRGTGGWSPVFLIFVTRVLKYTILILNVFRGH